MRNYLTGPSIAFPALYPRRQKGPVRPSRSRMAWLSSRGRGCQSGASRVPHHSFPSSASLEIGMVAPPGRPASHVVTCASDRKISIVLQVKPMSFHHEAAGTSTWNTRSDWTT